MTDCKDAVVDSSASSWLSWEIASPADWGPTPAAWDLSKSISDGWNSTVDAASGLLDQLPEELQTFIASGDSQASQGAGQESSEFAGDLCPLLVVGHEGVTFTVGGLIKSKKQQEIFDVRQELKHGCADKVLLRAYVAEGPQQQNGILLESSLGLQLAFIDTSMAYHAKEPFISLIRTNHEMYQDTSERPEVRAVSALTDISKMAAGEGIWATVTRRGSGLVHVQRRADNRLIMTVRTNPSSDTANVTDPSGRLLGSMNTRKNDAGEQIMVIQVGYGDAGLLLCALMAALKLSHHE